MIIKYKFADGTSSEVEVDEELGAYITASRREESNYNRKTRYHCISLDGFDFEGEAFADDRSDPARLREEAEEEAEGEAKVEQFLQSLTEAQRRRVAAMLAGKKMSEIAREEGTSRRTVADSIELVRKKAKKFF